MPDARQPQRLPPAVGEDEEHRGTGELQEEEGPRQVWTEGEALGHHQVRRLPNEHGATAWHNQGGRLQDQPGEAAWHHQSRRLQGQPWPPPREHKDSSPAQ